MYLLFCVLHQHSARNRVQTRTKVVGNVLTCARIKLMYLTPTRIIEGPLQYEIHLQGFEGLVKQAPPIGYA